VKRSEMVIVLADTLIKSKVARSLNNEQMKLVASILLSKCEEEGMSPPPLPDRILRTVWEDEE
jgi:hypothetical protein